MFYIVLSKELRSNGIFVIAENIYEILKYTIDIIILMCTYIVLLVEDDIIRIVSINFICIFVTK